ncbi:Fic family protein [Candidatus Gottesmanbacteria bacterium]|nr:Fic family protein [Candidatus Gottesmanbacteria bacterium]
MFSPKYSISNRILKNIGVVEASREVILNAPLLPAYEKKFREEAIVRTVHHGTHIEGNELNFTEAAQVLKGNEIVGRDRDIQEVLNYRNVLRYLDFIGQGAETEGKITENVVEKVHAFVVEKLLPIEQCGSYRKTQVVVKNSITGEITFRPPPAIEVPYQVEEFLSWLNALEKDELHPVLKAGITHYELVRIHPFVDGNGRMARAVATLVLFLENYDIKKFFSLEEYYDRDAVHYYDALKSASGGELTKWLEYFTQGLSIELTRIKEKILKLSTDVQLKEKLGGKQVFLTERQIGIMEYIQRVGYLQNQSFPDLFPKISEDTILRDLKDLMDKGIIKKVGKTKAARYTLG